MPKRPQHSNRRTIQSNTYRFFVGADSLHERTVTIEDRELAHQLATVLRLHPGDHVLLLDNSGWQYDVILTAIERGHATGTIERKELAAGEPRTKITLFTALIRPDRFEWVLQKGTELGVSAFVPLICERSTIADADLLSEHRLERWNKIVREAAEQSRRGKCPRMTPALFFPTACEHAVRRNTTLLLWEESGIPSLRQVLHRITTGEPGPSPDPSVLDPPPIAVEHPFSVALFSGPEGGFTRGEVETAQGYGMIAVTLGPRTLRAETAPITAAAAILYEMGDLE